MANKINHIRTGEKVPCTTCGKLIYRKGYLLKKYKVFFCSGDCNWKYKKTLDQSFQSGTNHPKWKGDKAGYFVVHKWVRKNKGKAVVCSFCNSVKTVEWANKSHKYKRELSDWISLCKKCHAKYDHEHWGEATKLFNL